MPLLARKTFVPQKLPADIDPDAEVFIIEETKEAFTSYESFLARYEQLRQPVWSCATTGKINLTYEQAIKSEQAATKQLQKFPAFFRRPALQLVHHSKSSLEPILDDVYDELHTRFAVGEPIEASLEPNGKQIDGVVLAIHEPPTTPPKSADTSMEQGSAAASAAASSVSAPDDGQLISDPLLCDGAVSSTAAVVNGVGTAAASHGAGNGNVATSPKQKPNKSDDEDDEDDETDMEPSPTYSVKFSDAAGTVKCDVDSDDITRLKRAPTRDNIRTFIKGCARRVRWRDSNIWVVKDVLVQELDLPSKHPELTYAIVTSAMSPVKKRRSEAASSGKGSSKKSKAAKGPMKQMTLLDMVSTPGGATEKQPAPAASASAKARLSLGGVEPETPTAKGSAKSVPTTPKTPDGKPAQKSSEKKSAAGKGSAKGKGRKEQEKVVPPKPVAPTLTMSKANKNICDKIKNLDAVSDQPKGYVSRVLTMAARLLSTPERNTLPPEQRKLVEERIAQRLKMEELKKMTPEERKAKNEEERKKKTEERRQIKLQQKLIEQETNRVFEDEDVNHAKPLPSLDTVSLPSGLANESFGDLAMVVEFLHVFQPVLASQDNATPTTITAGALSQALVTGPKGMSVLSHVLTSLLKIVAADQGNRKEMGIKISAMPLMPETAPELTRLLLLPSHLLTRLPADRKNKSDDPTSAAETAPTANGNGGAHDQLNEETSDAAKAKTENADEAMDVDEPAPAQSETASPKEKDKKKKDKDGKDVKEKDASSSKAPSDDEDESSDGEDYEDEDLSPQLVEVLVRLQEKDFQDLPASDKLKLLVALCGRVLSTTAILDFQEEKRDQMKQMWKTRIEEGKEQREKDEKEKKAKKEEQLKKQQKLMADAMDSFKVFGGKGDKQPDDAASAQPVTGQTAPLVPAQASSSSSSSDVANENVDPAKETQKDGEDVPSHRRPATERQMERERQLAKEKERREREAKELQSQREDELRQQRIQKFQMDIDNCKRSFRLMPLGLDRFRRRFWTFNPNVLPGLFIEDTWAPEMPEVRTHGEITPESSTVVAKEEPMSTDMPAEPSTPGSTAVVATTASVSMETDEKPSSMESTEMLRIASRWSVVQSVPQFEDFIDSLSANATREKALKESIRKQQTTLLSTIKKFSANFLGTADAEGDVGASAEPATVADVSENRLLDSYKEDLVEIVQRLYRGGLGDPGDLELFQAKISSSDNMTSLRGLLLDVYGMINPRFTQGILCPPDIQDMHLAMAKAEGKEKSFKATPCRLAEWKQAVFSAGTLSRLHLLQAILDECIQWHKSAENARCKICRKKSDDVNMLLCDDCNQGFHLYCLRPALHKIPSGHWACPSCQPLNARRSARGLDYAENSDDEEEEEEEEEESDESGSEASNDDEEENEEEEEEEEADANEDSCAICDSTGELLCCDACPRVFHLSCHIPPLRRAPRGKFKCCMCKDPSLMSGKSRQRSRSKSKQPQKTARSRSASTSMHKKSPSGRRGSRRAVESEESADEVEEEVQVSEVESLEAVNSSEEEEEDTTTTTQRGGQRGSGRHGRRAAVMQESSDESDEDQGADSNGEEIEEASDNTDTEDQRPARRTGSLSRASKRATVQSKGNNKAKRSASSLSSRAPPAKRRLRQSNADSDDEHVTQPQSTSRRGGKDSSKLKGIMDIMNNLISYDDAEPFALPVNPKDVPDYFEVVKEPMDFGTIRTRLKNMYYTDVAMVLKDVELVFHNCDAYNHSSTDTYKCGMRAERYFCKLLKANARAVFSQYSAVLI